MQSERVGGLHQQWRHGHGEDPGSRVTRVRELRYHARPTSQWSFPLLHHLGHITRAGDRFPLQVFVVWAGHFGPFGKEANVHRHISRRIVIHGRGELGFKLVPLFLERHQRFDRDNILSLGQGTLGSSKTLHLFRKNRGTDCGCPPHSRAGRTVGSRALAPHAATGGHAGHGAVPHILHRLHITCTGHPHSHHAFHPGLGSATSFLLRLGLLHFLLLGHRVLFIQKGIGFGPRRGDVRNCCGEGDHFKVSGSEQIGVGAFFT